MVGDRVSTLSMGASPLYPVEFIVEARGSKLADTRASYHCAVFAAFAMRILTPYQGAYRIAV